MEPTLLILDLDETLIRSLKRPDFGPADFTGLEMYHTYKRPYLSEFLAAVQEEFDLAVWTAGGSMYADYIVSNIFEDPSILKFVWSSDKCTDRVGTGEGGWNILGTYRYTIKKLDKVKKMYPLKRVLMVDDNMQALEKNYGNLVRVRGWRGGNAHDDELLQLIKYLPTLKGETDVRKVEKRGWRLRVKEMNDVERRKSSDQDRS